MDICTHTLHFRNGVHVVKECGMPPSPLPDLPGHAPYVGHIYIGRIADCRPTPHTPGARLSTMVFISDRT